MTTTPGTDPAEAATDDSGPRDDDPPGVDAGADDPDDAARGSTGRAALTGRSKWLAWAITAASLLLAAVWLLPMFWAVDTALKREAETTVTPVTWIPDSGFTLDAFRRVLAIGDLQIWFVNSIVTTVAITVITVAITCLAGYGLSRIDFRGRRLVLVAVLAGIMMPPQVLIVPLFREMVFLGLVDTYWGLILPQLAVPIAVIIFKSFFDGIPIDLEEAAIVDGASRLRVFWNVVVPLSRPVIAAVSVFVAITSWNNFLWPFIVMTNPNMMTIPVGLATVEGNYGIQYAQLMASAVLGGIPLLVVFVFFQRQIVQGIASTGLKG